MNIFLICYSRQCQISSTISVVSITKNTAPEETSCCLMLVTFIFQLEKEKHKPLNWNLCGPVKYSSCLIKKRRKGQFFNFWDHNCYFSFSFKKHNKNSHILRSRFSLNSKLLKCFIKLNCRLLLGVKIIKTVTVSIVWTLNELQLFHGPYLTF